jgi:hypothetical protein
LAARTVDATSTGITALTARPAEPTVEARTERAVVIAAGSAVAALTTRAAGTRAARTARIPGEESVARRTTDARTATGTAEATLTTDAETQPGAAGTAKTAGPALASYAAVTGSRE